MEFSLLNDQTGIVLHRNPKLFSTTDDIVFSFENAPVNSTVIFADEEGKTFYRSLKNGSCQLKADLLKEGAITVTVTSANGQVSPQKWSCEGIVCQRKGKTVVLSPNEMELPSIVVNLKKEVSNLIYSMELQQKKLVELEEKVSDVADGYDEL